MTKRMLIDATHAEETRVVVLDGNRLEDFDVETSTKRQLKGNIYLAKVVRVEPSLQAAFIEYGGNRHGFLAFSEIHPDYYQIPVADRQRLLEMQAEEARPRKRKKPNCELALSQANPGSRASGAGKRIGGRSHGLWPATPLLIASETVIGLTEVLEAPSNYAPDDEPAAETFKAEATSTEVSVAEPWALPSNPPMMTNWPSRFRCQPR